MIRNPYQVLGRALTTERSVRMREDHNRYAFQIAGDANKLDVKRAVEQAFKVHVIDVRVQNVRGKLKRMGRFAGRRPAWKKAIVKIKAGETLPLFEHL